MYVFGKLTETVLQCHRNSVNKSPHVLLITTHNSAFTHINNLPMNASIKKSAETVNLYTVYMVLNMYN